MAATTKGLRAGAFAPKERPDTGILARTHWGVAMGNAVPEAKSAARFHTSTNDQDGVAELLEQLLR
jgi:hydroxymethylpyrimidine pyrophosphatase-like HAD family hydrolase